MIAEQAQMSHFLIAVMCTYAVAFPAAISKALYPAPAAEIIWTFSPKANLEAFCTNPACDLETIRTGVLASSGC